MPGEPKPVSASRLVLAQVMTPLDANITGNVHGGNIMKLADEAAGVVAIRHCGATASPPPSTGSLPRPVYVRNLVTFKASLNYVGRTSMEIGVRVEAEDLRTGKKTHTNSCYITMVAIDADGKPVEVPRLILETDEDRRRHEKATARVQERRKTKPSGRP
jgi:acyl-CoA hydrolase